MLHHRASIEIGELRAQITCGAAVLELDGVGRGAARIQLRGHAMTPDHDNRRPSVDCGLVYPAGACAEPLCARLATSATKGAVRGALSGILQVCLDDFLRFLVRATKPSWKVNC